MLSSITFSLVPLSHCARTFHTFFPLLLLAVSCKQLGTSLTFIISLSRSAAGCSTQVVRSYLHRLLSEQELWLNLVVNTVKNCSIIKPILNRTLPKQRYLSPVRFVPPHHPLPSIIPVIHQGPEKEDRFLPYLTPCTIPLSLFLCGLPPPTICSFPRLIVSHFPIGLPKFHLDQPIPI
jgi:hypothetical protein